MSSEDGVRISENTLFVENEHVRSWISVLTSSASTNADRGGALTKIRTTFDKYLECPSLLDRHVEDIVIMLTTSAREHLNHCHGDNGDGGEISSSNCVLPYVLSALYALSKVRGRKRIQRFFPHETRDVEPVFSALQQLEMTPGTLTTGPQTWESVYVLWIWMDKLSLVPFDCSVVMAHGNLLSLLVELAKSHLCLAGPTRQTASSCLASWLNRPKAHDELDSFLQWSKGVLVDFQQTSSSNTLSANHNNGDTALLVMGVMETLVKLLKSTTTRELLVQRMEPLLWETTLAIANGSSDRGETNGATTNASTIKCKLPSNNLLLRKLLVKWFSRMACAYMPMRTSAACSWRYQRGRRCLLDKNVQGEEAYSSSLSSHQALAVETKDDEQAIAPAAATNKQDEHDSDNGQLQVLFPVVDQVEDAMGIALTCLADPSTIVRWSAAKGVGRMTERLPALCAHDVLDYILELCRDPERDHAWHGACLALAELARRGLLLPSRLADVVPLVIKAIQFDVRRGPTSVGAHVRDAACYTYWAFARAYDPSILKPFVPELSRYIVLAFLFDREVNCRRAASAAFQECVGRQGADNFKHGISILTSADYFSLGNINHAFTSIALHVAQFPEYQCHIIDHLYKTKLAHWDINIRMLASRSLNGLARLNPNRIRDITVPLLVEQCVNEDLHVRHGAVLGLAEVTLALAELDDSSTGTIGGIDNNSLASIVDLVPRIEKARLYRGRGGEIMRSAICRLIECLARARVPLTVKQQVRYLDSIDACLKHPNEGIQEAASNALHFLMRNYFPVGSDGPSDRLQNRVVDKYVNIVRTSVNPAETRGFALALGALPNKLLSPSFPVLSSVLECLFSAARYDSRVNMEADAETKRNALLSLARVCETVGLAEHSNKAYPTVCLTPEMVHTVFNAYLSSLEDYSVDRRGDVGSWSRVAAMSGLESLTYATASCVVLQSEIHANGDGAMSNARAWFDESVCIRIVGGLLKQFSEKLDSVRSHAGGCLSRILTCAKPSVPYVPMRNHLLGSMQLKPQSGGSMVITNWANPATTFRMAMAVADINVLFPYVVSGMIISVGGLGGSVSRDSEQALLAWIRAKPDVSVGDRPRRIANELVGLFRCYHRRSRVILPLLKTLEKLLNRGCLNGLIHVTESTFCASLLECLVAEAQGCNDVHCLLAIMSVSVGLLSSHGDRMLNDEILVFVCEMLSHRFPRVRRLTADHFYVRLLEESDILKKRDNLDSVLQILLEAPWDSGMTLQETFALSSRVAQMIGITAKGLASPKQTVHAPMHNQVAPVDEFANYASLVNSSS